mmetsp:Transcript_98748/g.170096  ORF Transcript_98748/g.170096 Transcript_98748/m.170096 type:complete len:221 (-) Transcript_98748:104-766(-)
MKQQKSGVFVKARHVGLGSSVSGRIQRSMCIMCLLQNSHLLNFRAHFAHLYRTPFSSLKIEACWLGLDAASFGIRKMPSDILVSMGPRGTASSLMNTFGKGSESLSGSWSYASSSSSLSWRDTGDCSLSSGLSGMSALLSASGSDERNPKLPSCGVGSRARRRSPGDRSGLEETSGSSRAGVEASDTASSFADAEGAGERPRGEAAGEAARGDWGCESSR